jgi:hypothetical protein
MKGSIGKERKESNMRSKERKIQGKEQSETLPNRRYSKKRN